MTLTPTNQEDSPFPRSVDLDALLATTRPRLVTPSRMLRRRKLITFLCLLIILGPLSVTLGYALYVRSDRYRMRLMESLSQQLGMTVSINGVEPLGPSARLLREVKVKFADDGTDVFGCEQVVWKPAADPSAAGFTLTLEDGWMLAGDSRWTTGEYERVLTGGLGHRFSDLDISEVRLDNVDVRFEGESLRFSANGASGILLFEPDGTGRASIDCETLNGVAVDRPVNIAARFRPGERIMPRFEHVRLTVPTISLAALGFGSVVRDEATRGTFAGTIDYAPKAGVATVRVSGSIRNADLLEYTRLIPGGPFPGSMSLDLREADFDDGRLKRLEFSGNIYDARMRAIAPALVAKDRDAILSLTIDQLLWDNDQFVRLAGSGQCNNLSLEAITSLIGKGAVTGTASLDVRSVLIVDDQLRSADATITAVPPINGPAIISKEVIAQAAERWLGVNPAALLPEQIEYLNLGARFTIEDEQLRVRGTHGFDGATILTVKLFGKLVGLVRELDRTFVVPDIVAWVKDQARNLKRDEVRSLWEQLRKWEQTNGD